MPNNSIPNLDLGKQIEAMVKDFVQEKLEMILREEIQNFLKTEPQNEPNSKMVIIKECWIQSLDE